MAYWAGNAFHITMTVRMFHGIQSKSGISDSWQTCGAGILIDDNFFADNVGLKRHNGGAGVIRCNHYESDYEDTFDFLSGKQRAVTYNSTVEPREVIDLADPSTSTVEVFDQYDEEKSFTLLTYGTIISNNTFDGNASGKRGTALLIELINELKIVGNRFLENGPVHAYKEM